MDDNASSISPTIGALVLEAIQINPSYLLIQCYSIGHSEGTELIDTVTQHSDLFTQLQTLDVHNNSFDSSGLVCLSMLLVHLRTLTSLSLDGNNIGDIGMETIAKALSINDSITSLTLQINSITDIGAQSICRMLRTNKRLVSLYLNGNQLGDRGALQIARAFVPMPTTSTSMSGSQSSTFIATSLSGSSSSTSSSLSSSIHDFLSDFSDCGVPLVYRDSVNHVETDRTTDVDEDQYQSQVNETLLTLSLVSNSIGNDGCAALACAIAYSRSLEVLLLNGNPIGSSGGIALAAALETNESLTCLNLHLCEIDIDGSQALLQCLANSNHTLRSLHISYNDGSQDELSDDIFALAATNARLHQLFQLGTTRSQLQHKLQFKQMNSDQYWLTDMKSSILCKRLSTLVGYSRTLTHLNLSNCRLAKVPHALSAFKHLLVELDISKNRIRTLPDWFTEMKSLRVLNVTQNPDLLLPPQRIQNEGCEAILKFLRELKGGVEYKRLKLLVLGHGSAGKTTLLSALQQLEQSIARPVYSWFQLAYNTLSGATQQSSNTSIPPPLPTSLHYSADSSLQQQQEQPTPQLQHKNSSENYQHHHRTRSTPNIQSTIGIDTDSEALILDPV